MCPRTQTLCRATRAHPANAGYRLTQQLLHCCVGMKRLTAIGSRRLRVICVVLVTTGSLGAGSCKSESRSRAREKEVVVWHTLGSWSGHGNAQTESFASDTGALRVRWDTRTEVVKDAGIFRLTVQSPVSGRPRCGCGSARRRARHVLRVRESALVLRGCRISGPRLVVHCRGRLGRDGDQFPVSRGDSSRADRLLVG